MNVYTFETDKSPFYISIIMPTVYVGRIIIYNRHLLRSDFVVKVKRCKSERSKINHSSYPSISFNFPIQEIVESFNSNRTPMTLTINLEFSVALSKLWSLI